MGYCFKFFFIKFSIREVLFISRKELYLFIDAEWFSIYVYSNVETLRAKGNEVWKKIGIL